MVGRDWAKTLFTGVVSAASPAPTEYLPKVRLVIISLSPCSRSAYARTVQLVRDFSIGSSRSRSASPRIDIERVITKISRPGQTEIHHAVER